MKSFIELERALFEQLAEQENKLLLKLVDLRVDPLYVTAIQSIYQYALDKDGNLKYSRLLQKIDRNTAKSLQTMQEELLETKSQITEDFIAEYEANEKENITLFDQNKNSAITSLFIPAKGTIVRSFSEKERQYGIHIQQMYSLY